MLYQLSVSHMGQINVSFKNPILREKFCQIKNQLV